MLISKLYLRHSYIIRDSGLTLNCAVGVCKDVYLLIGCGKQADSCPEASSSRISGGEDTCAEMEPWHALINFKGMNILTYKILPYSQSQFL